MVGDSGVNYKKRGREKGGKGEEEKEKKKEKDEIISVDSVLSLGF